MTDREAMKMVFNTLVNLPSVDEYGSKEEIISKHTTMTMLRQALAQPKQEPVAWVNEHNTVIIRDTAPDDFVYSWKPLYTVPPKQWIGLTEWECNYYNNRLSGSGVAEEIESVLRNRNT